MMDVVLLRAVMEQESMRDIWEMINGIISNPRVRQMDVIIGGDRLGLYNSHIDANLLRMCYSSFVRQLGEACQIRPAVRQVREGVADMLSRR